MRAKSRFAFAVLPLLAASGCMSEDVLRYDGVTTSAGNAIAANTMMQMVDPWQPGVENTRLRTPADIGQYQPVPTGGDTDAAVDY